MPDETPVSSTKKSTSVDAEPKLEEVSASNGFADRSAFLALVGKLKEGTVVLEDDEEGTKINVLVRELTGGERAELITLQAEAYQQGSLKIKAYEQKLLLAGIADPSSPKGARQPLLKKGDDDQIMKLGSSKVAQLVTEIESLSGLGAGALTRAEGNSETTPSDGSTSE
jgi:hypothetical protein